MEDLTEALAAEKMSSRTTFSRMLIISFCVLLPVSDSFPRRAMSCVAQNKTVDKMGTGLERFSCILRLTAVSNCQVIDLSVPCVISLSLCQVVALCFVIS